MRPKKWRIEKITTAHPAYINNPAEFHVGGWYASRTTDPSTGKWTEFFCYRWEDALAKAWLINYIERPRPQEKR